MIRIHATGLETACIVDADRFEDDRGFFTRLRCTREFGALGLPTQFVQTNLSFNEKAGTFRGLHYQAPPSEEGKLVRCIDGSIWDVIVDLRPRSKSYLQHVWVQLSAEETRALFVPPGFAHGFITERDRTSVLYEMTDYYAPELSRGMRWDDPSLNIELPRPISVIHERDAGYPNSDPQDFRAFDGAAYGG